MDLWSKVIFGVIATSLAVIAIEQGVRTASAQDELCGTNTNPCYITNTSLFGPLHVFVEGGALDH